MKRSSEKLLEIHHAESWELKEKLLEHGYTVRGSRRASRTSYYTNEASKVAVAFVRVNENGQLGGNPAEYPVLLEKPLCEKINYSAISLVRSKENANVMPCVSYKGRKNVRLSRILLGVENEGADVQVDHINCNRLCCLSENLRTCNNAENRMNRYDAVHYFLQNGKSFYQLEVGKNQVSYFKEKGFIETYSKSNTKEITMTSQWFSRETELFISYHQVMTYLYSNDPRKEFVYNVQNDLQNLINLLIYYYALEDITEKELHELTLLYHQINSFEHSIELYKKLNNKNLAV